RLRENTVKVAFISELRNRFQILQDAYDEGEKANVDNTWKQVTQLHVYPESSKKKLGFRKRNTNKDWIQQETLIAIEERKEIKKKMLQTKSPRLRERQEELYGEVNKRVKKLAHREKPWTNLQLRQRKQQYRESKGEFLNGPSPDEAVVVPEATEDLDIDTDPPTKEEIMNVVKTLKNGKSPGHDNLDAELFKADPGIAATILQPLFTTVWDGEKVPDDWCKGVIVKIPKKGALSDCNNWRGITLLSVPSKILAKIIIKRMSDAVDAVLRKEQAGFRKHRGCTEQMHSATSKSSAQSGRDNCM
ncbi:uncharacterized protein LOC134266630, partial [Saccostrea cucullata]|uniref:uncharacterized protein LOC134266630 n=1 Tax=Saccostrea cuccullata TaxID=36930 RepID=UPI002ED38492